MPNITLEQIPLPSASLPRTHQTEDLERHIAELDVARRDRHHAQLASQQSGSPPARPGYDGQAMDASLLWRRVVNRGAELSSARPRHTLPDNRWYITQSPSGWELALGKFGSATPQEAKDERIKEYRLHIKNSLTEVNDMLAEVSRLKEAITKIQAIPIPDTNTSNTTADHLACHVLG